MTASAPTITPPAYSARPARNQVQTLINTVQTSLLQGQSYSPDAAAAWTKQLSDTVRDRLRDLGKDRYKFIVQVTLGEQRTEGVHCGCRCLWDEDTDSYASSTFKNDELFCVVTAYWVYQY